MAGIPVYSYSSLHAHVRALFASMLSQQDISELANVNDFDALVDSLNRTVYEPFMMGTEDRELDPGGAIYQIKRQLAKDYDTVIRYAPDHIRPLLLQYYRSFEVDNLKAVLRGIFSHASWERVHRVLFPLGKRTVLPAQELVQSGSIEAALDLLQGTPYFTTLSYAMERFTVEQSLFPLEVALDLNYWREIWSSINQLSGLDLKYALRIVGSLMDMNNLMWAIRYRTYYNLSEEEIINYTLPFGYRVRDRDIRDIASGVDISDVVSRIYPDLSIASLLNQDLRATLPDLELQFQRQVISDCQTAFYGYPFHIGIPLGFMVLKRMQVQDLTVLVEAKASQMSNEEFRPFLMGGV